MAQGDSYFYEGDRFVLGQAEFPEFPGQPGFYAIWDRFNPYSPPVATFPLTPEGWYQAWATFSSWQPVSRPSTGTAPPGAWPPGYATPGASGGLPPSGPPTGPPGGGFYGSAPFGSPFSTGGRLAPPVGRVDVGFAGPQPQRRWTVLLRIFLLIPVAFVGVLLDIAAIFVIICAWFAALVTGRAPEGMARFLTGVLRYLTRLNVYAYLMTDTYPPFDFESDYPIGVQTNPGPLNRLAVLFRLVIAIPAFIVVEVVGSGLFLFVFVTWFIVLFSGQIPLSVYEALACVVRYQARLYGYFGLLASEYPWGLFGDTPTTQPVEGRLQISESGRTWVIVICVLGAIITVLGRR